MPAMRLLPVLDVLGGVVVRGVAGRRQEYRPVVSQWTASCQPAEVARALHGAYGLTEFYLADLDAIGGQPPAWAVYQSLQELGCRLWVDAGLQNADQARLLADAGVARIILGLETVRGPDVMADACRGLGSDRVVFSLDLKAGHPLGDLSRWDRQDAWSIAATAIAVGIRALIILDLARVGTGSGTGTGDLCARVAAAYPDVAIFAGGGICGVADLERLQESGVRGALVASALHDGRLRPADVAPFTPGRSTGSRDGAATVAD